MRTPASWLMSTGRSVCLRTMIEELFSAAREDQSYQGVLTEVKKGLT